MAAQDFCHDYFWVYPTLAWLAGWAPPARVPPPPRVCPKLRYPHNVVTAMKSLPDWQAVKDKVAGLVAGGEAARLAPICKM